MEFEKKQSISFFVQITKVAVHFRVRAQMRIDCATRSKKAHVMMITTTEQKVKQK